MTSNPKQPKRPKPPGRGRPGPPQPGPGPYNPPPPKRPGEPRKSPVKTMGRTTSRFTQCRHAFVSWCAVFLAAAFLSGGNVFAAQEATPRSKESPLEKLYGNWVAKDVDAKVGEVTINLSFREEGGMKLVAWSELFFVGKVKEMKGPYKVRGDTIRSKAIRGGTKAKFRFEEKQLVLEFKDGKIVRFHREAQIP